MEHTSVANPNDIERNISDKWYSYMDKLAAEHEMNNDDEDFLNHIKMLEEAEIIVNDKLKLPISAERTILKVECQGKKPFEVPVFQIFVPRRYNEAAKYLNDRALLDTQTVKLLTGTMSPFATKEDNIKLQEQTNKEIHSAVNTTNTEIASLKDGITTLLQRTNHLFASIHDPDETSPPRKTRQIHESQYQPQEQMTDEPHTPTRLFTTEADTDMENMDSVSGD